MGPNSWVPSVRVPGSPTEFLALCNVACSCRFRAASTALLPFYCFLCACGVLSANEMVCDVTGNNYAITNMSRTRTAHVFFAQGCEVEAFVSEEGQAQ